MVIHSAPKSGLYSLAECPINYPNHPQFANRLLGGWPMEVLTLGRYLAHALN